MLTPNLDRSKDDKISLNALRNTDIAQLLLISRTFVLDCWPAEEFTFKNGKSYRNSTRSLLHGALIRITATGLLGQISFGYQNVKGRRVLVLQVSSKPSTAAPISVHDIADHPWPTDAASKKVFEKALSEGLESRHIKGMSVKEVATTLHRLEQAKYWSNLKQKHTSQSLAAKQRSAIEVQMADCMRSADAPPPAELLAMVQAGCEEEEPGEVSDGRRALQRHLQEVKQRQQASLAAQPRAASARSNSRSVGSALENHPRHQNKASEVAPSEVAPSALCDKGLGGSSTKGDRSEAGISNRQEGSTPSSAGAVEVRVTVPKASRSPGDSEEPVNKLNKPSSDSRAQSQLSAIRAQQPGENDPSTAGRGDRLQGGPSNPAADSQAAQKQRRPLSANTPGQSLQATAGSSPGNGRMATPKTVAAAKHGVLSRTAPVPDASHHVSKQQPVAESPGIITSATIARLAPHGGPQQPMNGNSTMGLQPSRGTAACTAGSKRKATDTHQLCADGSGHAHQSNATLPPSATPSPSSISPGVKRKKIMWDPALLQAAETQQLSPSHSLHVLSSGRRKKPKQPALTAQNTSLGGKLPSNGPLVQPPLPPQEPPQAADPQHQEEQAAGSPAGVLGAKQEVKIFWSWGLGAAVQGQYGAHLMSMIPRSMNDQESGLPTRNADLRFSNIIYLESELQQLASTTCKGVYLVQCKGQSLRGSHKAQPLAADPSESRTPHASDAWGCSAGSVVGLMEHARLRGCLESSGAALALCPAPKPSEHQSDAAHIAAEGNLKTAAASRHGHSDKQTAGMLASPHRQLGGVSDTPPCSAPPPAPQADKAFTSDLTSAQIQAWLENVTGPQLETCMESPQGMEGCTGGLSHLTGSQVGVVQADPAPAALGAHDSKLQAAAASAGTASQAAVRKADDKAAGWPQKVSAAAGTSQASDSASQVGVLLVSGAHLQQWLAATNMSGQRLEPLPAACAAYSHAIYALILLHTPPDTYHTLTSVPLTTPGPTPSSLMKGPPCPLPPHPLQASSDDFQSSPSWVFPLDSTSAPLRQITHGSLESVCHTTQAPGRRSTPPSAADKPPSNPLHPHAEPAPSDPLHPGASPLEPPPSVSQQQHPSCQLHQQPGHPLRDSQEGPVNHPQLRPFHSHPAQLERAPEQKPEASRERARDSTAQPARHSAEEERFRGRQLRDGPLKQMGEPTPSGEAEQQLQQQQQATLSSKQELQQAAASLQRRSLDRSDSLHDNSAAQPVSAPTEGMQVSPKAEHTTGSANAVASPEQAALPSPTQSLSSIATPRPDLTSTCASDATASSDSIALLQGGQSQPGLGTPEPEPLSRGKRPELEESLSALDASAFHLMSGKPKQQGPPPSSPAAPKDGTTLGQSGKFIAAEALLGKPAGPLGSRAATASAAARRALPPAAAAQLAVEEHAEGAPPESHAQTASQEDGQGATQSKPKQRKRVYRQSSAGAAAAEEEAPEPKRPKPAAPALQQQVQVKPAPSIPAPQPQQQPKEAKPTKVREPIRHPEQPIDLPPSAVQNIYRSIRKLRLQGHGQHSSQLSNQHLDLLNPLPPLVQLRVLSKYASEVLPDGNVVKFFSLTVEAMRSRRDVKWLSQRDETATAYRLCDAAASLYGRLGDCGELPVKSVPTMTPQMVPLELQAAYILCIGGYIGSLSRREFADQLLMGLLGQVCITMHDHKASAADLKTAELNLKAAGASIAKLHQRLKQSSAPGVEPQRAQQATQGSKIGGVVQACFGGLVRLNRLKHGFADDRSMNFLQSQGPLWQLRIVSYFGCHLRRPATNASAFLTTVCRNNRDDRSASKLDWLRCIAGHVHPQTQSLLDQAYRAGILPRDKHIPGKIAALPTDLHFAAACFVVGAQSSDPSCNSKAAAAGPSHHATSAVEDFVRFAQGLIHEADPAAVPDYKRARSESASRSASRGASRAASQPPRNDQGDRTAARRGGQQPGAAAGALPTPADPRARPPSQAPDPQPSSSHQQGSGLRQAHASHTGSSWPRHCRYFYRMDGGCLNRQCDHYHGSHQEYVAYMVHCGLVPYSLKFASDVGRDKWIADAAVDGLNDMIVSQQLPRDSFSEGDLRPLAFLQDPNGDPARMQLQVVQRMAEHGPVSNLVQLLQSTCQQVQTQAQTGSGGSGGYSSMSEGYSRGPQEPFDSRGMVPMPEASFAKTSSSMLQAQFGSGTLFRGPADFTASPPGPPLLTLPLSLPFAHASLPSEDPPDGDIPFPVLRYEEELLAGMLVLQNQTGSVESVEQLLALQPQCCMPSELARHFQGDMSDRVLNFLQTRPWLFGVSPHDGGLTVTRLAREGLIYKRDVITYLYNGFIDGTSPVTLAEINDRVPQPPGMHQVMMENNGLLGLMDTQLFRDDVMLQPGPYGPQDIRVVLRSSGV